MVDDGLGRVSLDAYQVTELESDDPQWMLELLANPAFSRVPASHYQALLERFTARDVRAGQVLIHQGERGEDFFLLRRGRARVTRQAPNGLVVTLAELGPGQTFGEEALLSGAPRNATVTQMTEGQVMVLGATDFHALLESALVHGLDPEAAEAKLRQGAQLVDVRGAEEFRAGSLEDAINLPLFLLRMRMPELDRSRPCIVCCDDGRRSATAAFLLVQRGYDAHVLLGGLGALASRGSKPANS
jgi:rhodanese-related sulfurtransferase